jgi:hypothetical protein
MQEAPDKFMLGFAILVTVLAVVVMAVWGWQRVGDNSGETERLEERP